MTVPKYFGARFGGSGDDVGDKLVFQPCDAVFQRQLLFFQPPQGQLIAARVVLQGVNGIIQIAMFALHHGQPDAQHFFVVKFTRGVHGRIRVRFRLKLTVQ